MEGAIATRSASSRVRKAISVLKRRTGSHEDTIRELTMEGGLRVGEPLSAFRGVLTGVPTYVGGAETLEPDKVLDEKL